MTVIKRRSKKSRKRERQRNWTLDLSGAFLRDAILSGARLEEAYLADAHLDGANLNGAHLERAILPCASLQGAWLRDAHLDKAWLRGAHLEGAYLERAKGLNEEQLEETFGNASTTLPEGLSRPANWSQD